MFLAEGTWQGILHYDVGKDQMVFGIDGSKVYFRIFVGSKH